MTEITRVPIQPIKKGSLSKLWLGVAAVALAGAGLAWAMVPEGIAFSEITAGTGGKPEKGQVAIINYTGKLADGKVFDTGEAQPMLVGGNIPGFDEALERMETGGKYTVTIPSDLAYGAEERRHPMTGELVIPANSDLTFDVELLEVVSRADFERRMQIMQQMQEMQKQQQAEGAGSAPAE